MPSLHCHKTMSLLLGIVQYLQQKMDNNNTQFNYAEYEQEAVKYVHNAVWGSGILRIIQIQCVIVLLINIVE